MNKARSYTWRKVKENIVSEIKTYFLKNNWTEEDIKNSNELWRIKLKGIHLIFYKSRTLFILYSERASSEFIEVWKLINNKLGGRYSLPNRDILIGYDETGKGEVLGSIILAGVMFPKEIFNDLDLSIDNADTKCSHSFEYWERVAKGIMDFQSRGFSFVVEKILPSDIDNKNTNKVMDERYKKILFKLTRDIPLDKCRMVIDDYRVGRSLLNFVEDLRERGTEVIITTKSEDNFLETKIASIIAKWERMKELKDIGISFGTGNVGDKNTIRWLEDWYGTYGYWPWFVKKSFQTAKDIEKSFMDGGKRI